MPTASSSAAVVCCCDYSPCSSMTPQKTSGFTSAGAEREAGRDEAFQTRTRGSSTSAVAPGGGGFARYRVLLADVRSWERAGQSRVRTSLRRRPPQWSQQRKPTVERNVSKQRTGGFIDRHLNDVPNCFFRQVGVLEDIVHDGSDASLSEKREQVVKSVGEQCHRSRNIEERDSVRTRVAPPQIARIPAFQTRLGTAGKKG